MKTLLSISFILFIVILTSCSKKNTPPPDSDTDHPEKPPVAKLSISNFNPKSAAIGTPVMITGTGFGTDSAHVSIKFGNSAGVNPKSITDTKLTAIVPADASTGKVQITINGVAVNGEDDFTLTDKPATLPTISDFSPSAAQATEPVTINGTGFVTDTSFVSISFGNSKPVIPIIISPTKIVVIVPEDAQTGKITVVINGGTPLVTAETFTFKPTPVSIIDFSPKKAKTGDTVSVNGTGFGKDVKLINVTFGNSKAVKPISATSTKLQVVVPGDATTGKISLTVNNGKAANSLDNFTFQFISITSFAPKTVSELDTLKITGTFGPNASDMEVLLVDTRLPTIKPFKASATELSIVLPILPDDIKTTKIRVIDANSDYVDSKESLVIMPRVWVNSIYPESARPGQTIQINAINYLGADLNAISIKFGNSAAVHPLLYETSFLTVRVPNDAQSGYITVSKPGYKTGKTGKMFTVLPAMPPVQQGVWTKRGNIGILNGKAGAIAFTINGKAYFGCGSGNLHLGDFGSDDMWEYDQQYNAWTQKASFGGGERANAVAFSIGNKGYVGTGLTADKKPTDDFWEYDPQTNKWSQKANFKGATRAYAVGFSVGNKGYIGSGNNGGGNNSLNDFYEYNPSSNSWIKVKSMPGVRSGAFAFVVDSKAYIGNGYYTNSSNSKTALTDFYMYDPVNDTWTAKAAIPGYSFTVNNASFSIGSKGYVGLGYDIALQQGLSPYGTTKVYEYSTTNNSWKALPDLGSGLDRSSSVGFTLNNVGYFGMGESIGGFTIYDDLYAFKP